VVSITPPADVSVAMVMSSGLFRRLHRPLPVVATDPRTECGRGATAFETA
jgi:hypothetical protein